MREMPDSAKIYRCLLKLYPARFREEYGEPMEREFQDDYREASGATGRITFWLRTIIDLSASAPSEFFRELRQDLRHSFRVYRARPISTVLSVVTLGLAIGGSTGVFSVLNALLIRGLPFSSPDQLVELTPAPVTAANGRAEFKEWSARTPYLQSASAFSLSEMNLASGHHAMRIKVAETSSNFFDLLGAQPTVGRTFARDEDVPGRNEAAVISHSLWQQLFGRDPGVIGSLIRINGTSHTVIGVAPPRFDYPGGTSVWMPTVFDVEKIPKRGAFVFQTIGRLNPNTSLTQAGRLFENANGADPSIRPKMISLRNRLAGPVRDASWVWAGMILLVLLTACANVAHLLLSRTAERRQELAVRAALGASRSRLVQQLTTEATVLTASAALLGLVVAHWVSRLAASVAPAQLQTQSYTMDWRVVGFAALLAIAMGLIFGVMPARLLGRLEPSSDIARTREGGTEAGRRGVQATLVALQAGLAVVLIAGSMTLGQTFLQLIETDLGFNPANVVTMNVSLQGTKQRGANAERQFYAEAINRLRAVPGVRSAGAVSYLPLATTVYMAGAFKLDGGQPISEVAMNAASPGYFESMGTTLIAGRDFAPHPSEPEVIVNEEFARNSGLATAVLGRKVITSWSETPYVIVGIVNTARAAGPAYPGAPQIYWRIDEEPPAALTLTARVNGDPQTFLAKCRDAVQSIDPFVPVYDLQSLDDRLNTVLARPQFYTTATVFLAFLAIVLAAVGTYGTAAFSVAQRTRELGIRMALGAPHGRVRRMMVSQSVLPILIGSVIGVAGAFGSGHYLEHLVANTGSVSLWTCAASAFLLAFAGSAAVWMATDRLLTIDPADAVRAQ